jgi:hypothetical protein
MIVPMMGESSKDPKKNPQKPNRLLIPNMAINRLDNIQIPNSELTGRFSLFAKDFA